MKRSPCSDCPEKGCGAKHDTCEKYQDWNRKRQEMLVEQNKGSESYSFQVDRIRHFKKEKWKGGKSLK